MRIGIILLLLFGLLGGSLLIQFIINKGYQRAQERRSRQIEALVRYWSKDPTLQAGIPYRKMASQAVKVLEMIS